MKRTKVIIEVPKSLQREFGGLTWWAIEQEDAMFYQNEKEGKPIHARDYIVQSKKSGLMHASTNKKQLNCCYKMTVKELESLLKLAKERQKQFKECFFLHPFPDLSIFFVAEKKKKVVKGKAKQSRAKA